jgi:hypothetical protein
MTHPLVPIHEKKKIPLKIAAKLASVEGKLHFSPILIFEKMWLLLHQSLQYYMCPE